MSQDIVGPNLEDLLENDETQAYGRMDDFQPADNHAVLNEKPKARFRNFCGALFAEGSPPRFDEKKMKFLCFSPELTKDGRFHYQWYCSFKAGMTKSAVAKYMKKEWGPKAGSHSVCMGSAEQNSIYCGREDYSKTMKDGTVKTKPANEDYQEWGEMPMDTGKSRTLDEVCIKIRAGETTVNDEMIADPELFHKYGRTLERVQAVAQRKEYRSSAKRNFTTTCDWYYGPTGTGKSHKAYEGYTPDTHYNYVSDGDWGWDAYEGQETVIINEFRGELMFKFLLTMIDKWPMNVRRRGMEPMPFVSKHVIITSSQHPKDIYTKLGAEDRMEQLYRRVNLVLMDKKWVADDETDEDEFSPRSMQYADTFIHPGC